MYQKSVVKHAVIGFLTWFVLLSCALMAYAEGNAAFNGRPPEPYASVYSENSATQTFAVRKDGAGLYAQLRDYYAPLEPAENGIGFRLTARHITGPEFWEDSSELELENGQTYTVEMAMEYRGIDGLPQRGMYFEQPGDIAVNLFCDVTVTIMGAADGQVWLNGAPIEGTEEIFDYNDAILNVGEVEGYTCRVLCNGVLQAPDEENEYHLGALEAETELVVEYSRTNVHYGTPAHAEISLVNQVDCFTVTVTPDAGYVVQAVRVNGAVQAGTAYAGGVAVLTLDNGGEQDYFVTADIAREQIAAVPSPVVICRAGWEDELTKEQIFAAAVDPAASVPSVLTADDVEIEYQGTGTAGWIRFGDPSAEHPFGAQEQEVVRFLYQGSADGQYPAFVSEAIKVTVDRQTRDVWLTQPAHGVITSETDGGGEYSIAVVPDEGYAVASIFIAEGRGEAAEPQDVAFQDGAAFFTFYRTGEESYTITADLVKETLAILSAPALVFREAQDYSEQELRAMILEAAVDGNACVPAGIDAEDVEIRYLAQEGAAAAGGERLDYQPGENGGHAFGSKDVEHIYITYKGSRNGQYRAVTEEFDLILQRIRRFALRVETDGAAPEQGGATLLAMRGGETRVIEDGAIWEDGETVVLSVLPITGYKYEVTVNGAALPYQEDDLYTLGVLCEDTFIQIHYMPSNMTIEETGHSTVKIGLPDAAGSVTIQAVPAEGHAVAAILLNGASLPNLFYQDGVAFGVLTPQQALLECRISVETVEERLAIRSADLTGYGAVAPSALNAILFESVLDVPQCVPQPTPADLLVEYRAAVEIPALNWAGEIWLPTDAEISDVPQYLPASVLRQLPDGDAGITLRPFGRQTNETLRITYLGSAQYRSFAQELTVSMPDYRAETQLCLRHTSLSVEYGCTEQELEAQLLALVTEITVDGVPIEFSPDELTVTPDENLLSSGTHTAVITYQGNAFCKSAFATVEVTVAAGAASVSLRVEDTITYGEPYEIRVRTNSEDLCYALVVACTKGDKRGYVCITLSDTAKEQMRVALPGREGTTDLYKTAFAAALEGSTLTEAIDSLEAFGQKYGALLPGLQLENIIDLLNQVKTHVPLSQCRVCLDDTFTQTGDYFVGVITVDANYSVAKDTASITIQRNGSGVSLEWNNQGKTLQILSRSQAARTDFGATLYDESVQTTNKSVKNSVITLCAGMTFDKQLYVSSAGPENAGVYVQTAFVVNPNYPSERLFRGILIFN